MKYSVLLLFASVLIMALPGCKDDDDPRPSNELSHAGDNDNSPALPAGTYMTAARFTGDDLTPHIGKTLEEVVVHLFELPSTLELIISRGTTNGAPAQTIYFQDVNLNNVFDNRSNTIFLDQDITITSEDLWIAFRFSQSESVQIMGCDAGPRDPDGDWLFVASDNEWTTYQAYDQANTSINWNIIGRLGTE